MRGRQMEAVGGGGLGQGPRLNAPRVLRGCDMPLGQGPRAREGVAALACGSGIQRVVF